jgi:hypothetical protein
MQLKQPQQSACCLLLLCLRLSSYLCGNAVAASRGPLCIISDLASSGLGLGCSWDGPSGHLQPLCTHAQCFLHHNPRYAAVHTQEGVHTRAEITPVAWQRRVIRAGFAPDGAGGTDANINRYEFNKVDAQQAQEPSSMAPSARGWGETRRNPHEQTEHRKAPQ